MKSFNVDDRLKDPLIIENAIYAVYKSLKRSKWPAKHRRAEAVLADIDAHVEATIKAVENFEEMMRLMEQGKPVPAEIVERAWHPKPYSKFTVKDGPSKKEREIICATAIQDKIIHQLVIEAAKPVFMRSMYHYSCGSVPGRGTHKGVKYLKRTINRHNKYDKSAIKYGAVGDVKKCYQSFSHKILNEQIRKKFRGKLFAWLMAVIIDCYHHEIVDDEKYGIPIGFPTSLWLCNFGLTPMDHKIKSAGIRYYMRYVDDIVMFGRSKKRLHKVVEIIKQALINIGLRLKSNWQVFRYDYINKDGERRGRAFDVLGFRFFRDKTILRKRNVLAISRQARRIGKVKSVTPHMARSMLSRMGSLKHCHSRNYYTKNVKPYVNIKKLKEVISIEDRKRNHATVAV